MIFRIRAEVQDCKSVFSSAITAALHANSITASRANRVFAKGQILVIQVVRKLRYCGRIWLGLLEEIWAFAEAAKSRIAALSRMSRHNHAPHGRDADLGTFAFGLNSSRFLRFSGLPRYPTVRNIE